MAETTGSVKGSLRHPGCYSWLQRLLGADAVRRRLVREYLDPVPGERILDLGCGPGDLLPALPTTVAYVGVDLSERYIEAARRRFGDRGDFSVMDARSVSRGTLGEFDAVISVGLLHHLGDADATGMLQCVRELLSPSGRFLSLDPGFDPGQPRSARWLMERDRGANIRSADEYEQLVGTGFEEVRRSVHHDLARVPYTHVVIKAWRPRRRDQSSSA